MNTSHKTAAVSTSLGKSPAHNSPSTATQELAAFIKHHHHLNSKALDKHSQAHAFVDVKGNKHVAEHLGISEETLELSYEALAKELAIKRHGENRVEIVNATRLAAIAKGEKH